MSQATDNEIKENFKRHVRLHAGIGEQEMINIVREHFHPAQKHTCQHPIEHRNWSKKYNGSKCNLCGSLID